MSRLVERERSRAADGTARLPGRAGPPLALLARSFAVPALLLSPTLLALVYFGLIATPRYVSEAQFVVRVGSRPIGGAGLGAILQMAGLSRAPEDVFAVQSFMGSRTAVEELSARLPLRDFYGRAEADFVARYPSVLFGPSAEHLHAYLRWMYGTVYNSSTGITTLRVQAFRSEDAAAVARELLELGEDVINRMNERILGDAVRLASAQVAAGERRLVEAQIAITRFRNAELMIDPASSSVVVTELIAKLSADLTQAEAQLREVSAATSTNPLIPSLRRRIDALQAQIRQERQRISSETEGLADKIASYERLVLDREFAKQTLTAAVRALETSQQEALRQQLYLERVVEPVAADYPMAPARWRLIASALGLNVIAGLVGWLVFAGVREHAAARR